MGVQGTLLCLYITLLCLIPSSDSFLSDSVEKEGFSSRALASLVGVFHFP